MFGTMLSADFFAGSLLCYHINYSFPNLAKISQGKLFFFL